jgi:uncharacterized membrane protein
MVESSDSHPLAHWVHWSLLLGVVLSGVLLGTGLAVALIRDDPRPELKKPLPVEVLLRDGRDGNGVALIYLGLLALMVTPVLRVVVLVIGWGVEGDWRFAGVALAVLGLLGVSVFLGLG